MPTFSDKSNALLDQCHPALQKIFRAVVLEFDCRVVSAHRNQAEQNALFHAGKSKLKWPKSKHNTDPSMAADVAPYPIDWKDRERMTLFAGYVLREANRQSVRMRWGGDWNHDWQVKDNVFDDLIHFELLED